MIPKEFINAIQSKIDSLDDGDVKRILMWSEFKEFASMWKPKGKSIEDRAKVFYDKVAKFIGTYQDTMLREFYDYWSEHGDNDKKMRFEKQTSFSLSRRLSTWHRRSKGEDNGEKFKANEQRHSK